MPVASPPSMPSMSVPPCSLPSVPSVTAPLMAEPAVHIPVSTYSRAPNALACRAPHTMPPVPPLPIPAAAMPPPKLEPQPQSGPSKRLLPYLPLTAAAATAASDALATLDPSLVERLVSDARFTARSRGAVSVTARDFAAAAAKAAGIADPFLSPAAVLPVHYDEVVAALDRMRTLVLSSSGGGLGPRTPRVLVVGETHGVVANMFARVGVEVATCDLKTTDTPKIPHFQGDASHIMDLGWDLVIAHPPCTYLANAGVTWLHRDPNRWEQTVHNADVFRRMYHARAPFVAVENSKMHRYGRVLVGVEPTQYVHPWQHGTGHTKPTGLFLRNLPPLRPSHTVTGREHALARLPPSPDRSTLRSRTYVGIAAAMVLQWTPTLLHHTATHEVEPRPTAAELVALATNDPGISTCQVAFVRRSDPDHDAASVIAFGDAFSLPACACGPEASSSTAAISAWMTGVVLLPPVWARALKEATRFYPGGHRQTTTTHDGRKHILHLWAIDVSYLDHASIPATRLRPSDDKYAWSEVESIKPWKGASAEDAAAFQKLIRSASRITVPEGSDRPPGAPPSTPPAPTLLPPSPPSSPPPTAATTSHFVASAESDSTTPTITSTSPAAHILEAPQEDLADWPDTVEPALPASRRPWLMNPPDHLPITPPTRLVRYRYGHWHAWSAAVDANELSRTFSWQPLPPDLDRRLNDHLRPIGATLSSIPEASPASSKHAASVEASGTSHAVVARTSFQMTGVRRLWDVKPPPPSTPRLGLGADSPTPSPPPCSSKRPLDRAAYFQSLHSQWKPASTANDQDDVDNPEETLTVAHLDTYRRALDRKWTATPPSSAPSPEPPHAAAIQPDDLALTPTTINPSTHALYIRNLCFLRHQPNRKGARNPLKYDVGCAVAYSPRTLCDTGAGPSIVTTEALEVSPADCVISRQPDASVGVINGPDGNPLRTEGTATISFDLNGTPCRHEFVVAVGKPLLLLGQDFLEPRRAELQLNEDGRGGGTLTLSSTTVHGRTLRHSTPVTTSPRLVAHADIAAVSQPHLATARRIKTLQHAEKLRATVAAVEPASSGISGSATPSSSTPSGSIPIPAAQLVTEALEVGSWKLDTSEYLLYAQSSVKIASRSIATALLRAPRELCDRALETAVTCFVDNLPHREGLETRPSVIPRSARLIDGHIEVQILNLNRHAITIPAHSPVALLDTEYYVRGNVDLDAAREFASGGDYYAALSPEQKAVADAVTIDPDKRLSDEQRNRVLQLVARHITAFAIDPKSPTKTHLIEVELPIIPGATPHRHAPSKLGEEGRKLVEKHVEEMESRGIIRKSNSAWGSRVVLVTKKDGSIRFCVDYRDLNSKLQTQDSPLPLTVEAIDRLSSGQGPQSSLFLSTLDLAAGFWTLPIREEDKGLTAFVTHRQKYEFNYLPFGIQSGPSYMSRLMDAALQGLAWETCMPYLDDVGIWSTGKGDTPEAREASSYEQMFQRLEAVFERFKWAGLSMKASKCMLYATSCDYLGHTISRRGLHMDKSKVEAVASIDPTSINTLERVRSFLGLCSYYRRFISGFSKIAACLHDLTKDGVDVAERSQSPECQAAVRALITAITTEPVLATPRYDRPFVVKTDAANSEGLGGVLSQADDDGKEHVIAYYGRRLNKHERNYTVTEIELLAAVESIKNWRPYLWGKQFKLVIDHQALRWLHTMRDTMEGGPASRLMRWILRLQEYNFTVEHKPGLLHKDADGVSRLVAPVVPSAAPRAAVPTARRIRTAQREQTDRDAIITSYLDVGAPPLDTLRDEQQADPVCIAIYRYLDEGHAGDVTDSTDLRQALWLARETCPFVDGRAERRLFTLDGVIYRRLTSTHSVPFVPASLRPAILTAYHDRLGHPSANRTAALIRERYYWPNLAQEAIAHVSECHECTLAKHGNRRPRHPIGPTLGHYPFDVLYCDILDMAQTHDYDKVAKTGATKLVVFVDSLSRWVEAIPVHGAPTSAQVLDIFMTHVVSRHGAPRRVIPDHGSNLASQVCDVIMSKTGVDLRPSSAEHHEVIGTAERFQQTLIEMTRAANEGGGHWVDHLPFLLMSYRATPHRITKLSPSMMIYGRELRLPAQLQNPLEPPQRQNPLADANPDPNTSGETNDDSEATAVTDVAAYARSLHRRLVFAWRAARDHVLHTQAEAVSDTVRTAAAPTPYQPGDRVARRLYDSANKLEYIYAGPYRVDAVLDNGRYRLTDLENNHVFEEFDTSNIRPYRTHVDADELQPDEYIVDELLKHRMRRGQRQYLVRWRGYARSKSTWEPRSELQRRCAELLTAYDAHVAPPTAPRIRHARQPSAAPPPQRPETIGPSAHIPHPDATDSYLPVVARFERGQWLYGRNVSTARGVRLTMLPARRNFTEQELQSDHFVSLRRAALGNLADDPSQVAALRYEERIVALHHTSVTPLPQLPPIREEPLSEAAQTQTPASSSAPSICKAAKVWFARVGSDGLPELLSFVRWDSREDKPQFDTFGGGMEAKDDGQYHRCALRELREEMNVPRHWKEDVGVELASSPDGRLLLHLNQPHRNRIHHLAMWVVRVPEDHATAVVRVTTSGATEVKPNTLKWRPVDIVTANLESFRTFAPIATALRQLLSEQPDEPASSSPSPPSLNLPPAPAAYDSALDPTARAFSPSLPLRSLSELLPTTAASAQRYVPPQLRNRRNF